MIPVPQCYQLFSTKIAVSSVTGKKKNTKKPRQVSEHDLIHLLRISVSHWRITLQSPTVWGRRGLSVIVSTLRLIVNWSFQSCFKAIFSPQRRLLFIFFSPRPLNLSATATPISKRSSIWGCRLANPPDVSWKQKKKQMIDLTRLAAAGQESFGNHEPHYFQLIGHFKSNIFVILKLFITRHRQRL